MSERMGCLGQFLKLIGIKFNAGHSPDLPNGLRDNFLTAAELSFYRVLESVLGDEFTICSKVNLADLFFVKRPNENIAYRNKIDRKHVDFVLCDSKTMKPLCGIELDDSSHLRQDRIERDDFVNRVFQTAGLPLVRIHAARSYTPANVKSQIESHLRTENNVPQVRKQNDLLKAEKTETPLCPKCQESMVRRTAKKGDNKGNKFWGCQNYPKCKQVVDA